MYGDTVDKTGRPIFELWLTDWDVRKAAVTGKLKKLHRGAVYRMESQWRQTFEARAQGLNITQGTVLVDTEGTNVITHMCPTCKLAFFLFFIGIITYLLKFVGALLIFFISGLPLYAQWASVLESNYPYLWNKIYLLSSKSCQVVSKAKDKNSE